MYFVYNGFMGAKGLSVSLGVLRFASIYTSSCYIFIDVIFLS